MKQDTDVKSFLDFDFLSATKKMLRNSNNDAIDENGRSSVSNTQNNFGTSNNETQAKYLDYYFSCDPSHEINQSSKLRQCRFNGDS